MGADGGVAWCNADDPKTAQKLLAPWWNDWRQTFGSGGCTSGDNSRIDWMRGIAPDLYSAYGTDQGDFPTLDRLPEFLDHLTWITGKEDGRGLGEDATFDDYLLELQTRPTYGPPNYGGPLEDARWFREWIRFIKPGERSSPYFSKMRDATLATFRTQKIRDWIREVQLAITGRPNDRVCIHVEETWT